MTKQKQVFRNDCRCIKKIIKLKYHIYISIQTLSTLLKHRSTVSDYSLKSSWHTCIWRVSPILLCRFSQAQSGWMASVAAQLFSGWVQDRALAGPLKNIQRLVPKPFLCCLCCVLRVVVLLEGEPLPQSEVLSALEQVFIKDRSVLLSLDPD